VLQAKLLTNNKKKKDEEKDDKNKKDLINDDNPLLIEQVNNNPYMNPNFYGDFNADLNPFGGGQNFGPRPLIGGIGGGGNLMGPQHPNFGPQLNKNKPNYVPPNARFDPWGPGPLGKKKGPNPDHQRRPNDDDDDDSGMFL